MREFPFLPLKAFFPCRHLRPDTDLLLCGYPSAMCPLIGIHSAFEDVAMLTVVNGAGALTEYVDPSLVPYVLGIYKRWLLLGEVKRRVAVLDRVDPVLLQVPRSFWEWCFMRNGSLGLFQATAFHRFEAPKAPNPWKTRLRQLWGTSFKPKC